MFIFQLFKSERKEPSQDGINLKIPSSFVVDNVQVNKKLLKSETIANRILDVTKCKSVDDIHKHYEPNFGDKCNMVARHHEDYNVFMETIHLAYQHHYPLSISPDHIWILITNGLASHINMGENAEKLRREFIQFDAKKKITIYRPDFSYKNPNNDWNAVIQQFSSEIEKHIGTQTHEMIVCNFSTTGLVEKTVSQIVLMDCLKSYFEYSLITSCGIPSITLEGTVQDWISIKQRVQKFEDYGLSWWLKALNPILDQFIAASQGKVNQDFWRHIYKHIGGSGGPYLDGWIADFFPYLTNGKNQKLGIWKKGGSEMLMFGGPFNPDQFPQSISRVPVKLDIDTDLFFCGGFIGTSQNTENFTLRPEIGWSVIE